MDANTETIADEMKVLQQAVADLIHRNDEMRRSLAGMNIERISTIQPGQLLREPFPSVGSFLDQFYDEDSITGAVLTESIAEYAAHDCFPVPALEDREYYYPNQDLDYWLSGLRDFLRVQQELGKHGVKLNRGAKVMDLGSASGRVIRHFAAQVPEISPWCCDVNYNHVQWVSRHLPSVTAFQNTSFPALPIEDRMFDLVTAFSVFTHIDELEGSWLMELNRILKPGGYAYLTVQSERVWHLLKEGERPYDITFKNLDGRTEIRKASGQFLYWHLKNNQHILTDWKITSDLFNQPMPDKKVVFRFNNGVVYNTCTFHHQEYLRSEWGKIFEWVDFFPSASSFQDAVLLRKRC